MKTFRVIILMSVLGTFSLSLKSMEPEEGSSGFYSIILPGQNGGGGKTYGKNSIRALNYRHYKELQSFKIDLGQGNCVNDFLKQLQNDKEIAGHNNILLHGISQGTATLVRAITKLPEDILSKVKCLTLESVLADGNSAIVHTVNKMISSKLLYLPFSRWWLPLAGKCLFPTYNPLARQTLYYAKQLPDNLPVIIMHDIKDFQLSVNDARQLYCVLQEKRKDVSSNVYLFETKSHEGAHLNILDYEPKQEKNKKIKAVQQIYKNHGLPYNASLLKEDETVDISEYQPTVKEVKERIYTTNKQFRVHNIIDTIALGGLAFCAYLKWGARVKGSYSRFFGRKGVH